MNQKKKLNLLGFFLILNVVNFHAYMQSWYGFTIVIGNQSAFKNRSSSVNVTYFPQKTSLFCGPACVRMILYKVQGGSVSQFVLKDELLYREKQGTRNLNMKIPFENRDIEIVDVGCYSSLNHLKKSINKGQYSIINIKFDEKSNFGHYVVVTGYNETGIFLNDPWPERWGEHCERETGENAYISNKSLKELWSYRKFWVLTISSPESEDVILSDKIENTNEILHVYADSKSI